MKKALVVLAIFVAAFIAACSFAWMNKASLSAYLLARQLRVPVTIDSLHIDSKGAQISKLWIGTPAGSRLKTGFASQTIAIDSTYSQITGDPLVIDRIELSQIVVGVEMYDSKKNNWTTVAKPSKTPSKKEKDYLIKTLILNNLTVQVMQPNGTVKTYPTIKRMEFHNISSATGFPIKEIEKAIFNLVMQDLFKRLNLDQLIETLNPTSIPLSQPLKALPKLFN